MRAMYIIDHLYNIIYIHTIGIVDEDTANVIEGVADAAQNQAEADRDATITDRLKMAGTTYNAPTILSCHPMIM